MRFTDEKRYFVSEVTVYRLLKAHDLITSPAYVVITPEQQNEARLGEAQMSSQPQRSVTPEGS